VELAPGVELSPELEPRAGLVRLPGHDHEDRAIFAVHKQGSRDLAPEVDCERSADVFQDAAALGGPEAVLPNDVEPPVDEGAEYKLCRT
jgi:hypothetical protein